MENKEPISMGNLNKKPINKLKIIIISVLTTIVILFFIYSVDKAFFDKEPIQKNAKVVTLKDVTIAYAPETKEIIFLNRSTGQVQITLSDSLSMAIFALKSSEVMTDYNHSLKNKK